MTGRALTRRPVEGGRAEQGPRRGFRSTPGALIPPNTASNTAHQPHKLHAHRRRRGQPANATVRCGPRRALPHQHGTGECPCANHSAHELESRREEVASRLIEPALSRSVELSPPGRSTRHFAPLLGTNAPVVSSPDGILGEPSSTSVRTEALKEHPVRGFPSVAGRGPPRRSRWREASTR
jgi:hypothetical protein